MTCPASGTDRFANARPLAGRNPDPHYDTAQCWDCLGQVPLEDVPERYGLPGTRQVLVPHERPERTS